MGGELSVFLIVFLFLIGTPIVTAATGNLAIPLVMGVIFVLTLLVASEVPKASSKNDHHFRNSNKDIQLQENICCPNCGSPVMVRNHRWECGYCGDFGGISSLHPSEKAKLLRASASSVQVTITVTVPLRIQRKPILHAVSPARNWRIWSVGGISLKMSRLAGIC